MPVKIACPAGHKLVLAGSAVDQPLVCPRCGLPVAVEQAVVEEPAAPRTTSEPTIATSFHEEAAEAGPAEQSATTSVTAAQPPIVPARHPALPVIVVEPQASNKKAAAPVPNLLYAMLVVAALFSSLPALYQLSSAFDDERTIAGHGPARWALLHAWLSLVLAAYGIYGWLWSDASSLRVVRTVLILQAGLFSALLAIILLAHPHGWILGESGLQLTEALSGGKAALVCLSVICLSATLALFASRQSVRWKASITRPRI